MNIDKSLKNKKSEILQYFRQRADEFLSEINLTYGSSQFKEQASEINKDLVDCRNSLIETLLQQANKDNWTNTEKLETILLITYTNYIVMLESRNDVWKYEYMTFSRRIGELWEPFCKLCFQYPINDIELFIPPLFSQVKQQLSTEIETYIDTLSISSDQKQQLKKYYNKVWGLVTSGEIKLEMDLHFKFNGIKYIVDFKSGFGSNEKGNTNRLLLVASIYQNLEENYKCMLFVRSAENNNYYQTLKNSNIWGAFCGNETYSKIFEYSGFEIKTWITNNIQWENDFKPETYQHFSETDLLQYLTW